MKLEYRAWIDAYAAQFDESMRAVGLRGLCAEATTEMAEAFPELRRVRGHYRFDGGGSSAHWWCEAPDGSIVDPTVSQFARKGRYEEYTGPDPLGKCLNCGDYVWQNIGAGGSACSIECYNELAAEYGMPRMQESETVTGQPEPTP